MLYPSIASIVRSKDEYTTSSGERWTWIRLPGFRRTDFPTANQFVSTWGRLMNNRGDVVGAVNDYIKVSVPTTGDCVTAVGASTMYSLHVVVCYTFHGDPSVEFATVDHINRKHWDNRAENLRWASPEEQFNNRERYCFRAVYEGEEYQDVKTLARATGRRVTCIRGLVKQGDESLFRITKRVRVDLPALSHVWPVVHTRTRPHRQVFVAFKDGKTSQTIAQDTGYKVSTVLTYVIRGLREAPVEERLQFRERIGLHDIGQYRSLLRAVAEFRQGNPTDADWAARAPALYLTPCVGAVPPLLPDEFRIVQSTYKVLWIDVDGVEDVSPAHAEDHATHVPVPGIPCRS